MASSWDQGLAPMAACFQGTPRPAKKEAAHAGWAASVLINGQVLTYQLLPAPLVVKPPPLWLMNFAVGALFTVTLLKLALPRAVDRICTP